MKLKRVVAVILCVLLLILPVNNCWAYYKNEHNIIVGEVVDANSPVYHGYWRYPDDRSVLDISFGGSVTYRGISVGQTFVAYKNQLPGIMPSAVHIFNVYPKSGYFCTNTKYVINFFTIKSEVPYIYRMSPGMTIKYISSKRTELPPLNSITYQHSAKYLYTHSFEVICTNGGENIIDYCDWFVDEQQTNESAYDYEPKSFTHRFFMPAKEHVYESRIIQEPTCDSKGEKKYTCNSCGAFKLEEIPAKGHNWKINQMDVEATCTNEGSALYKCSNCEIMKTEIVPKLEHIWQSKYTLDIEPTCIEDGQKSIHCKVCDTVKEDSISRIKATGHSWDAGKVIKAATCTKDGEKTYTCSGCGETKTETIKAAGHKMGAWKTVVSATTQKAGRQERSCTVCNYKETRSIPKFKSYNFKVVSSKSAVTYNGKAQKPVVTVYAGNKKISSKYYTVSYKNNMAVGTAMITIQGKGNYKKYSGKTTFRINLQKTTLSSAKSFRKGQIQATWKKKAENAGYQIQYATNAKFSGAKTKNTKATHYTFKGLKSKRKYYVRVRNYKKVGSNYWYSKWSNVRNVKIK